MTRPLLLDLFCCEGGAAAGYHAAGACICDGTPATARPVSAPSAPYTEHSDDD